MDQISQQIKAAGLAAEQVDKLPGGQADNAPDSRFNPEALAKGKAHEMEHTNDPDIAEELAKDHLIEDPNYYEKLDKIEAVDEDLVENMGAKD